MLTTISTCSTFAYRLRKAASIRIYHIERAVFRDLSSALRSPTSMMSYW